LGTFFFGERKKPERARAQGVGFWKSCESTVVRCILFANHLLNY